MPVLNNTTITTSDGAALSAIVITPDTPPLAVIQFHAGTVIRKEFYLKFASYMAEGGFAVVLFDYRGVGGSRPKSLKGYDASIADWGIKDAPAVLKWIKDHYVDTPVHLFAHSMGGQIIGLMHNWTIFDQITVVASSSGNWNNFHSSYRRKIKLSTELLFPFYLRLHGYVPGRYGVGQDWPKGVAKDWWYNSRQNGLMANYMQTNCNRTWYDEIDKPINAYFISDDKMATKATILNYQKSYPRASVNTHLIEPSLYGFDSIGHFGLFKEKTKGKLWDEIISGFDPAD